MASISLYNPLNDYYLRDPETGWDFVNFDKISCQEQAKEIVQQCFFDADALQNKAIGKIALGAATLLAAGGVFFVTYKISTLVLALVTFPLLFIPPLYALVVFTGSLGVASTFSYHIVKKYALPFFKQAKEHWDHGNYLYDQIRGVRLEMPLLPKANWN